jgi:CRP-like cAMP-binding protein
MWNTKDINPTALHSVSLVSGPELQALFHQSFDLPYTGRQAVGLKSSNSRTVAPWNADENLILATLSLTERTALAPLLERVTLTSGQVIVQPGMALQHVYFPIHCSFSWVSHTADGESAELALVGREGLVGVPWVLGGVEMQHTVQVQCGGQALRMRADEFLRQFNTQGRLHHLALLYVQWQIAQMAQSILCSRHHAVSERLSHWLLRNAQGAGTQELRVTHDTIAHMLGVRRESVTQAAGRLQAEGWIAINRGKITLKDPDGLSTMACECHARGQVQSRHYLKQLARVALQEGTTASIAELPAPVDASMTLSPYGLPADEVSPPGPDLQKYMDVYDFAPVGLVTLDAQGRVLQTNLAGAILLDIQRSKCQHHLFSDGLDAPSQVLFAQFHQEVLGGQCRRHCCVWLKATAHRNAMPLRIDATADEWGVENRMVLIDLSDQVPLQEGLSGAWQFQSAGSTASPLGFRP